MSLCGVEGRRGVLRVGTLSSCVIAGGEWLWLSDWGGAIGEKDGHRQIATLIKEKRGRRSRGPVIHSTE